MAVINIRDECILTLHLDGEERRVKENFNIY